MKVTDELVEHIAHLARLSLKEEKREAVKSDLTRIIDFFGQLTTVDTEEVEPLIFMTESINVLRKDEAKVTIDQEEALRNAPQKDSDYFKIAKVLHA